MLLLLFFAICFLASLVGAVCGIGGGILIKPFLDAFQMMDVVTISFLSGCTVLSMSTYSVMKSKLSCRSNLNSKIIFPLSIGAALGGIVGKWLFSFLIANIQNSDRVGAIQAVCLILVTLGTLVYTLFKNKINTYQMTSPLCCISVGVVLGNLSSFLGIGGGPVNLVALFFFFSMTSKEAAENSLYIIFFSQIASLLSSLISGKIPELHFGIFLTMVMGGVAGGILGRAVSKHMEDRTVDRLFVKLMISIIFINIYNVYKFMS